MKRINCIFRNEERSEKHRGKKLWRDWTPGWSGGRPADMSPSKANQIPYVKHMPHIPSQLPSSLCGEEESVRGEKERGKKGAERLGWIKWIFSLSLSHWWRHRVDREDHMRKILLKPESVYLCVKEKVEKVSQFAFFKRVCNEWKSTWRADDVHST